MAVVGLLTLEIHVEHAHSLKDKRQILRSLKDRLRRRCNVAVAELDHARTWQDAVIGIAAVSSAQAQTEKILRAAEAEAGRALGPHLVSSTLEIC